MSGSTLVWRGASASSASPCPRHFAPNPESDQQTKGPSRWSLAAAGAAGALVGTIAVHSLIPAFTLPEAFAVMPESPSPDMLADYRAAYRKVTVGNASSAFAIIGACLALPLGFLGCARSPIALSLKAMLCAGVGGIVGGGAAGFVVANAAFIEGRAALPIYKLDPMLLSVLIQFAAWGAIGLGLGLALTCCRRGFRTLAGVAWGLWGGFMAAIMHAVLSSIAFPSSELLQAVPSSLLERLIWAGGAGLCLGLCMLPLLGGRRSSTKELPPPS